VQKNKKIEYSMNLKLAGYEMAPRDQFHTELMSYCQRMGNGEVVGQPPMAAKPVFTDDEGNHYVASPSESGVAAVPFIPGSPADGKRGGFIPLEQMPKGNGGSEMSKLGPVMAQSASPEATADWLAKASASAMLNGAPGSGADAALKILGASNPIARSAVGGGVAAAANMAGMGAVGSLLAGGISGGPTGLANVLGSQGASALLNSTPLGNIPGMSALAGMAGGQIGNLASSLLGGVPGLESLAGTVGGGAKSLVDPNPKASSIDFGAIGAQALDQAANKLMEQWKVDDSSSAGEHIAKKMAQDYKGKVKEALTDWDKFWHKVKMLYDGAASTATLEAARMTDPDTTAPDIIMKGVATILADKLAISRVTDPMCKPSGSPTGGAIVQGSATVLSAELPTARATSKTSSPDTSIAKGTPKVLVGDYVSDDPPKKDDAKAEKNDSDAPAKPDAPKGTSTGSSQTGDGGKGSSETSQSGDSVKAGSHNDDALPGPEPQPLPAPTPAAESPLCMTPTDPATSKDGTQIPAYFDPNLPDSTYGGKRTDESGQPYIKINPEYSDIADCIKAHEVTHYEQTQQGVTDSNDQEIAASRAGAACAQNHLANEPIYAKMDFFDIFGYHHDQYMDYNRMQMDKSNAIRNGYDYPPAAPESKPPICGK
jgi:uncharacterized Zn-binding protein involved in type VI secretion